MPRALRSIIPGYPYHITHRGNDKQQLFFVQEDFRRYLFWFEEIRKKFQFQVLAFCIMPNHVHYVGIASDAGTIPKTMQYAHSMYAQYFHREHGGFGHVWQGRYFSCLLDQTHLYAALRYVERNPSRAGLSVKPWEWTWSSARSHVLNEPSIVSLADFKNYVSISSWKEYIDQYEDERDLCEIRKQTNAHKAWGSDEFKSEIKKNHNIDFTFKAGGRPRIIIKTGV